MTYIKGSSIAASDYGYLLNSVTQIYGVGTGDYGYGQTGILQDPVSRADGIRAIHWGNLRGMLSAVTQQQGDDTSGIYSDPVAGAQIVAKPQTIDLVEIIDDNRLVFSDDAFIVYPNAIRAVMLDQWNGTIEVVVDINFVKEDSARFFFNSGGCIYLNLAHASTDTAEDTKFGNFLANRIGRFAITAHEFEIDGSAALKVNGGYYGLTGNSDSIIKVANPLSTSATADDQVEFFVNRRGYAGERGGNGSSIQIRAQLRYMGDASGSKLRSGLTATVDIRKASTYLVIAQPNSSSSGFRFLSRGNVPSTPGDTPGTPGTAPTTGEVIVGPTYEPSVGTVQYVVPDYATITFELWGGGGSEGSSTGPYPRTDSTKIYLAPGVSGGDARIPSLNLIAKGGAGGGVYDAVRNIAASAGADGTAEGGDENTTGAGSVGGADRYAFQSSYKNGGKGGRGGYVKKVFVRNSANAPAPGSLLTLTVPSGGSQSGLTVPSATPTVFFPGNDGTIGRVRVTYTRGGSGSATYQSRGVYRFTVPDYTTLSFSVNGAGGGMAHPITSPAFTPGYVPRNAVPSKFNLEDMKNGFPGGTCSIPELGLSAFGGEGGYITARVAGGPFSNAGDIVLDGHRGGDGGAQGGDVNTVGEGAFGGAWNLPRDTTLDAGSVAGGRGGKTVKTYTRGAAGAPTPGQILTLNVPAGGDHPPLDELAIIQGRLVYPGDDGAVFVTWEA